MIGRILPAPTGPDDNPAESFVPLRHRGGDWVPMAGPLATEIEAARACAAFVLRLWPSVEASAKAICGLTEHPDFDFDLGSFDADTVRDAAQTLLKRVGQLEVEIARLLDAPESLDHIRIGSVLYRHDLATGRIEPVPADEADGESDAGDDDDGLTEEQRAQAQPHIEALAALADDDKADSDGTVVSVEDPTTPRVEIGKPKPPSGLSKPSKPASDR